MNQLSTQILAAKAGEITEAMKIVARKERCSDTFIMEQVATGKIVIPANINHKRLSPIGIGSALDTKINANIGNSSMSSGIDEELSKLDTAVEYGADTVMDLSTGEQIDEIREAIVNHSIVPIGTVPIYEATCHVEDTNELTPKLILEIIEKQAEQGVDYMTIHAGLLKRHIAMAEKRMLGIVSRGGAILARWMRYNNKENLFYTHFDEILKICVKHDVTLSLGDGLRPGCLADASDDAQFSELEVLGELVQRCRAAGVQAMVEGPGHIPFDEIQMNMEREDELCDGAPFYILGPVVTDCAPGYDQRTSAIGATMGAFHGAAMLCYVTPKEHLGLPNAKDVRDGVIAYKIAAHAADIANKRPNARDRDDAISRARVNFDWETQMNLAMDPAKARELRNEALRESAESGNVNNHKIPTIDSNTKQCQKEVVSDGQEDNYCTMCGPKFCSMRLFQDAKEKK